MAKKTKQQTTNDTSAQPKTAKVLRSKKFATGAEKTLDNPTSADVSSAPSNAVDETANVHPAALSAAQTQESAAMITITLKRDDKQRKSNAVTFTADGYVGSVRFSKSFFTNKTAPETFEIAADSLAAPRVARAKMTKEERKAWRDAQPKLTDAQKLAKVEERAAKLKAKIAKSQEAPATV